MTTERPYKVILSDQRRMKEILHGFHLAKKSEEKDESSLNGSARDNTDVDNDITSDNTSNQCLTCKCSMLNRDEQIEHYKGDWHRYNLKLKLLGQPAVSEEEFADASDVFSISGSDTDEDDDSFNFSSDDNRRMSVSILKQESCENRDEQLDNRRPKIYFQNSSGEMVSVYKKVLYSRQNSDLDGNITQVAVDTLTQAYDLYWCVILLSAGHFASAVFQGSRVVVHKTFHRYVVRAKRGVAQSLNDSMNRSNVAKSAGANLRRYNEIQLEENIKTLLKSWKDDYLDKCSHIFLRIPNYRKVMFYGGKESIFDLKDSRIRSVPFVTRRPTFNEVQRVHQELYSVTIHGENSITDILSPQQPRKQTKKLKEKHEKLEMPKPTSKDVGKSMKEEDLDLDFQMMSMSTSHLETFSSSVKKRKKKKKQEKTKTSSSPVTSESGTNTPNTRRKSQSYLSPLEQLTADERDLVNKLYTACKTTDVNLFNETLNFLVINNSNNQCSDATPSSPYLSNLLSMKIDNCGNTLIHVAAKTGHKNIITKLLEHGSDPTVKNNSSFLPYCVCPNKEARNCFRKFRAKFPDLHDYTKAQIPSPLTEEREVEMKKKQNEKKKAKQAARKEKERNKKEEEQKRREEEKEKERFLALSDRDKRLIAIERRLLQDPNNAVPHTRRCFMCGEDMVGKVPFEYLDFKFCSMKCLKSHKSKT